MGGPTSPALFHLLQDWSSNWANVKTRRKSNHPKVVQKTSHGNKNWTHNSTTEWSFSQCFYFSTHILSFHTASQAGLLALMPHQTFNTGFPPPENLTPRSLSWSLQGKQSKLLNTKKKILCHFLSSWAVVLTALLKLLMPRMKRSFSMIFIYQPPDF